MTQQQLGVVRSQIGGKKREKRMMELTMEEVKSLPKGVQIYEGVGKM